MATMENAEIPQPPLEPPPSASSVPQYSEMIMAAIESLDEAGGSNKSSISKYIEDNYGAIAANATLIAQHLNRMRQGGELVLVKNNYMKPDPNAPPRRGRGRPPKPKVTPPPGTVISPPRPRGRPPKERDPFAPPPQPKKKAPSSGRPRGRPSKKPKTDAAPGAAVSDGSTPRGRGRPPKVKPAVAPVAC